MTKPFHHTQLTSSDSPGSSVARNSGAPLDLEWIRGARVEQSVVDERAATIASHRVGDSRFTPAWLLRAITCIDLTSVSGDETQDDIRRLCAIAREPVRQEVLKRLGPGSPIVHTAAVCVYHAMIAPATEALRGSGVLVAAVSAGFPSGRGPLLDRLAEIRASVWAGADEIDAVVDRTHILGQNWSALYDEVRAFRVASGRAHLKTILATGELDTMDNVARASLVCMMAGADFIKTSTGQERVNATLPVGLVMVTAIREYWERTGNAVGFKPSGGIRSTEQALEWLVLMKEELGDRWLWPDLFRIGTSSLVGDIVLKLGQSVTEKNSTREPSR